MSLAESIHCALTPLRWATSTRRLEFELFGEHHHQDEVRRPWPPARPVLAVLRG